MANVCTNAEDIIGNECGREQISEQQILRQHKFLNNEFFNNYMNDEILGGLRNALERGDTLQKAMMTFYNAGYKKEEIEEAARFLSQNPIPVSPSPSSISPSPTPATKIGLLQKKEQKPIIPVVPPQVPSASPMNKQIVSDYEAPAPQPSQVQQNVSGYGEKKSSDKVLITVLITILVLLFGILGAIFLFKNEIINFFSSMFG